MHHGVTLAHISKHLQTVDSTVATLALLLHTRIQQMKIELQLPAAATAA